MKVRYSAPKFFVMLWSLVSRKLCQLFCCLVMRFVIDCSISVVCVRFVVIVYYALL